MTENEIAKLAVAIFFKIHYKYGPCLLECVYVEIFCYEYTKTVIPFTRQQALPVVDDEIRLELGFRSDEMEDKKY